MSIKAIEAKVVCNAALREALWHTHECYNRDLVGMILWYLRMRNGSLGRDCKTLWDECLLGSGHPSGIMETLTSPDPVTESEAGGKWKPLVRAIRRRRGILFDRKKTWPWWSQMFRRHVFDDAAKWMRQHEVRQKNWNDEHDKWVQARAEFEAGNPAYMAIRPVLMEFEAGQGQVAKRRHRWHLYLSFLATRPALAAWRGAPRAVQPLTDAELAGFQRDRRRGIAKAFALFWERNPELKSLDRLHGRYQREFIRPWAKKRNADGFKHRPAFTMPAPTRHPEWITFQKDGMSRRIDLDAGTVELSLLRPGAEKVGWMVCHFKGDARLRWLLPAASRKIGRDTFDWTFMTPDGETWPAQIKGVRLLFRHDQPYVKFTLQLAEPDRRLSVTQKSCDKYSTAWVFKQMVKELDGQLPTALSLDLGIRHLAAAVVIRDGQPAATRFMHLNTNRGRIPDLGAMAVHKRTLRRQRSRQGRAPKGRRTCKTLQDHLTNMGQDRYKKGASAIVQYATKHAADVILIEALAGFIPDAERERGINRALVAWNRGNLVAFIKTLALDYGIRVVEIHPAWTSQLCNRCGRMGCRYGVRKGQVVFEPVGKLFACPVCGYRANADYNAAVNIYKSFSGELEPRPKRVDKGLYEMAGRRIALTDIQAAVLQHIAPPAPEPENPF